MMGGSLTIPPSPSSTPVLPSVPTQEVDAAEIQVQVCLYAFDLIYLNGEVSSSCMSAGGWGHCVSLGASGLNGHTWATVLKVWFEDPRGCLQDPLGGVCEALNADAHVRAQLH